MDRIIFIIFLLAILPYTGIPNTYDIWIVFVLIGALLYAVYLFITEQDLFTAIHRKPVIKKQDELTRDVSDNELE